MRTITKKELQSYHNYLLSEEKSTATIEKYLRDTINFLTWISDDGEINKTCILEYKARLIEQYAPASVNSILSSLNSFFNFMEWHDLKVKNIKIQKTTFASTETELTKIEYGRLLQAAKQNKNQRLYLLMQTICSTGIRVSEVCYITVDAITRGVAEINCKGKRRRVYLPQQLRFLRYLF